MRQRFIFLLVLAVVFTGIFSFTGANPGSAAAEVAFQRVNNVTAMVTGTSALNVRQGPATSYPIVCTLKDGQTVKVFGKLGSWYAVYDPAKGCVGCAYSAYLKPVGTTQPPIVTPKPTTPAVTPKPTTPAVTPKPTTTATPKPGTTAPPAGISQEEQTLLNLINKERSNAGIAPLAFDMELEKVARLKAQDMVNNNYFSHQSPTYGSPFDMMRQFGVSFKTAGENIAGNQTLEGAVKAWMNSEGHRKNILNANFNYTGIGIAPSPTYGKILVQQFIGK